MVLCQVRENRRIEFDARNSMFGKRVARNFHDDDLNFFIQHVQQNFLQIDNIRRGVAHRKTFLADKNLNRADESDLKARAFKNFAEHVTCRGLAIGARDSDNSHLPCRIIIKIRDDDCQRVEHVGDNQRGNIFGRREIFSRRQNRNCTFSLCLRNKIMSVDVCAFHANK